MHGNPFSAAEISVKRLIRAANVGRPASGPAATEWVDVQGIAPATGRIPSRLFECHTLGENQGMARERYQAIDLI
jgi:hypothetical protein